MSKVVVTKEKLVAIGDALRDKTEATGAYSLDEMPEVIQGIETGGGGADFTIDNAAYLFYGGARYSIRNELFSLCKDVTSMSNMFYDCRVASMSFENFPDTSKVTDMQNMFRASRVQVLDLSNFDTSKVQNMSYMFYSCSALSELDLSSFNTSNVTNMSYMFYDCSALKSLNLTNFNTGKVQNMSYMFNGCDILESLNLSNFDTSNVTNMGAIFSGSNNLKEIIGFSATNKAGLTIGFPFANVESQRQALKRLTFRTDLPEGIYSIRSAINLKYCSFDREGMVETFNTLPDITAANVSANYKKITITGNPCVVDGTLTEEDKAIATNKGWTLVI